MGDERPCAEPTAYRPVARTGKMPSDNLTGRLTGGPDGPEVAMIYGCDGCTNCVASGAGVAVSFGAVDTSDYAEPTKPTTAVAVDSATVGGK